MLKKEYKYFLFDLDRTLWDFETNSAKNISDLLRKYFPKSIDHSLFLAKYTDINNHLWTLYENGKIEKEYLRWARFHETFKEFGISNTDSAIAVAKEYLDLMPRYTTLMPWAKEVLDILKSRGAHLSIVTNGFKEVQYEKLAKSNIIHYFESIIISEELGVRKPSPIIFKKAMDSINGNKEETLMIGDDFTNDIEGAMIFGIDQFYYNLHSIPCEGKPTYESSDLRDVTIIQIPQ
jgi:putative hydrolase of the HAD superfamily